MAIWLPATIVASSCDARSVSTRLVRIVAAGLNGALTTALNSIGTADWFHTRTTIFLSTVVGGLDRPRDEVRVGDAVERRARRRQRGGNSAGCRPVNKRVLCSSVFWPVMPRRASGSISETCR